MIPSNEETIALQFKQALLEAGLDENLAKGVVFPFGVKFINFNGKKVIQPLTSNEYKQAVFKTTGRTLSDEELERPKCVLILDPFHCENTGCRNRKFSKKAGRKTIA